MTSKSNEGSAIEPCCFSGRRKNRPAPEQPVGLIGEQNEEASNISDAVLSLLMGS